MKKNVILSSILMLFAAIVFSGCSNNEPDSMQPSPRDGVYEGENLKVSINGEPLTTITSVKIISKKIPYAGDIIVDGNGENGGNSSSVYDTQIIFNGFPQVEEEITLIAVSSLYNFNGVFSIKYEDDSTEYYEFIGTFTGEPDSPHSEQGLILKFNKIDNPLLEP